MSERAVLGCSLLDDSLISHVRDLGVAGQHFSEERNRILWSTMCDMADRGLSVDMVSVVERLSQMDALDKIGGAHYVSILTDALHDPGHLDSYINGLKEGALRRSLVAAAEGFQKISRLGGTKQEMVSAAESEFKRALEMSGTVVGAGDQVAAVASALIDQYRSGDVPSVPTKFRDLNDKIGGFYPQRFYLLAGRPGMGKTAVMLEFARFAADDGYPAAVFSLEMSSEELVGRLLSQDTGIPFSKVRSGVLSDEEWERLEMARDGMTDWPLLIQDGASVGTIEGIASHAKSLALKGQLKILFIDYLQLVTTTKRFSSKNEEVSRISRDLKLLAKELEIPIVCLSQLNRESTKRKGLRPRLEDLRDSGSLEQDADGVLFVFRHGYNKTPDLTNGKSELILEKHRHGETGTVFIKWDGPTTSFNNWT